MGHLEELSTSPTEKSSNWSKRECLKVMKRAVIPFIETLRNLWSISSKEFFDVLAMIYERMQ